MSSSRPSDSEPLIGHPVIAFARRVGCTEGQLYTMVTAVAVAVVLGLASASGGAPAPSPTSPTPVRSQPGGHLP
ncbi:MAG: hypothetical protein ACYDH6_07250 [Acidimicrobiales bacterium]